MLLQLSENTHRAEMPAGSFRPEIKPSYPLNNPRQQTRLVQPIQFFNTPLADGRRE